MDRRLLVLVVAAVALIGVVNATVFAYRWMTGTVQIAPAGEAEGAACTGFYSSADQSGIDLPDVGTNYNALTYGTNTITVTPGDVACQFTNRDGSTGYLYESIDVNIPVTVGSWYIQDFYGFGYFSGTDSVYVWFRVEDPATDGSYLTTAKLVIYKVDSSGTVTYVNELDLLGSTGTLVSAGSLSPGEAFRLDLRLDAYSAGTVSFKVGVYVSQENEAPVSPTP
ncbi:MAG: hypothetical protein LM588_03235 [Fervidicoccaceae archaeon]|nr:hypothetical protein [Fervidicoccaceae archaeon]